MIASVHLADVGIRRALQAMRKRPGALEGLRWANVGTAARFAERRKPPSPGRAALIAFWDDDSALDRFLAEDRLARMLANGWSARLEPLRAFGSWPGLPEDLTRERSVDYDGPAVVLTLGRLRLSQTVRFFRTSSKAEKKVVSAPGAIWATALARPPFLATCSLWEDARSLMTYAYGNSDPRHHDAIREQAKKDFHKQSAFVRFRPYDVRGSLSGTNPLPENALSVV